MASDDFPAPKEGFVLTHFIVAKDVARSRDFYTGVLGGTVVLDGEPTIVKLANGWVIINVGGGPTDDKPEVVLEPPTDPPGPAPSSTCAWPTSRPRTRSGVPRGPSSSPRPRSIAGRSAATCATPTGI
jgi:catechol 2,3-dioxygenase-like lactoylglutathione lyase family enzyme